MVSNKNEDKERARRTVSREIGDLKLLLDEVDARDERLSLEPVFVQVVGVSTDV